MFPSIDTIFPCKLINSPSHTSTLSPVLKECVTAESSLLPDAPLPGAPLKSNSTPSGASSNLSNSDKVGFTPSAIIALVVKFLYKNL